MNQNELPKEIQNFLIECIETVSQLELLIIIFENQQTRWNADSISRELRTHPSMAAKQMEILEKKGILKKIGENYTYSPKNNLDETIKKLNSLYHERPVAIVTFIYTKPEDKLKGFADAFKFKKD